MLSGSSEILSFQPPENEFKTEHYRRINYANKHHGRGTPTKGWKTDRGRIYIILGEPQEIQKCEHETEIIPTEIWFYQGKVELGPPECLLCGLYQKRYCQRLGALQSSQG